MTILSYVFVAAVFVGCNIWLARFNGKRFDRLDRQLDALRAEICTQIRELRTLL